MSKKLFAQIAKRWLWLLPFLVSILPYFALKAQIIQFKKNETNLSDSLWMDETDSLVDKIKEATTEKFWAKEIGKRFEYGLHKHSKNVADLKSFVKNFNKNLKIKNLNKFSISFMKFDKTFKNSLFVNTSKKPVISKFFCKKLFQQIGLSLNGRDSNLDDKKWKERLFSLFGYSITQVFFTNKFRTTPFNAIIQEEMVVAYWNFFKVNNNYFAYLLKMKLPKSNFDHATNAVLANWKSKTTFPIFLSLPTDYGHARVIRKLKFGKNNPSISAILGDIQQEMIISAPQKNEVVGKINLPVYLAGNASRSRDKKYRYRIFALSLKARYLGVLFNKIPPSQNNFLDIISFVIVMCITSSWILFFAYWFIFGHTISFGIKPTLYFWFIGLVATPALWAIGAEYNYLQSYKKSLLSGLYKNTVERLQNIDRNSQAIIDLHKSESNAIINSARLFSKLKKIQQNRGEGSQLFLDSLWKTLQDKDINVIYLSVLGRKNFYFGKSDNHYITKDSKFALNALSHTWKYELVSRPKPTQEELNEFPDTTKDYMMATFTITLAKKIYSSANKTRFRTADVSTVRLGEDINVYANTISNHKKCWYCIGYLWVQKSSYIKYLSKIISETGNKSTFFNLSAYQSDANYKIVSASTNDSIFISNEQKYLKQNGSDKTKRFVDSRNKMYLNITYNCQYMHNFTLCATVNLDSIKKKLNNEVIINTIFLLISLIFIILISKYLSNKISLPLIRISDNLGEISSGNLNTIFVHEQNDEIGNVCNSLNSMVNSMKKRKKLSEFVAFDVMKSVSGGQLDQKIVKKRKAVVLSTDIRSFTTMSEAHTPESMFTLLNEHLAVMSKIIKSYNGIIDRFIGDAIIAVFYESEDYDYIEKSVFCAIDMMKNHNLINIKRERNNLFTYNIGIGLDEGKVLTGILGDSSVRLDFSILGNAIQNANNYEALSKLGKASKIIVSESIKTKLQNKISFIRLENNEHLWEIEKFTESIDRTIPFSEKNQKNESQICKVADLKADLSNPLANYKNTTRGFNFITLGLMPLILLSGLFFYLERAEYSHNLSSQFKILQHSLDNVSQIQDPLNQLGLALTHKINQLSQKLSSSDYSLIDFKNEFVKYMAKVNKYIPELSFTLHSFKPDFTSNKITQDLLAESSSNRDIVTKENSAILASYEWRSTIKDIIPVWLHSYNDTMQLTEELFTVKSSVYPNEKILKPARLGQSHNSFAPETINNTTVNIFWRPIFENYKNSFTKRNWCSNDFWNKSSVELFKSFVKNILGIIQFHIATDKKLSLVNTFSVLLMTYSENFGSVGFVSGKNNNVNFIPPQIINNDKLINLIKNSKLSEFKYKDWLIVTRHIEQSNGLKLFIVKKFANHKKGFLEYCLIILMIIAFFSIIFTGINYVSTINNINFSINSILSICFISSVIPVFLLGMMSFEKYILVEKQLADKSSLQQKLSTLKRIDKAYKLFESIAFALSNKLLSKHEFKECLIAGNSDNAKHPRIWETSLAKILKKLLSRGFFSPNILYLSPEGRFAGSRIDKDSYNKKEELVAWLRAHTLKESMWKKLTKSSQKRLSSTRLKNKMLLIGSEIESVADSLYFILGKLKLNSFLLAPVSLSGWQTSEDDKEFILKHSVWYKNKILGNIQIPWDIPGFGNQFLNSLTNVPDRFASSKLVFKVAQRNNLSYTLNPPFIFFHASAGAPYRIMLRSLLGLTTTDLLYESINSKKTVSKYLDNGLDKKIITSYITEYLPVMALIVTSDIGKIHKSLDKKKLSYFKTSLLFLLFVLLLSKLITRRFLKPIQTLTEASNSIQNGDFSTRLPNEWEHEYGMISKSFNNMAIEAEEGRLLGKFVSESVKSLAKNEQTELQALEGKRISGVILFTCLKEFKTSLPEVPPQELFSTLNEYLKAMSGIIRENNEEIDKFIGDKILAVFHADKYNSLDEAITNAVNTSIKLTEFMNRNSKQFPFTLGIGIVSGQLLAGIMGTELVRREYTVIGDTVNLAARLSDLATHEKSGGVIVESQIAEYIAKTEGLSYISLSKHETTSVKGKKREVEVFKITSK